MLELILFAPFVLQSMIMGADEFYFHHRRRLNRWERVGHPMDTLTVIAAYSVAVIMPFSKANALLYGVLAAVSSLVITKDEWVHQRECKAIEHWLHSLLFVIHPIVLLAAGLSWYLIYTPQSMLWREAIFVSPAFLKTALNVQWAALFMAVTYQITYWNFYANDKIKHHS